MSKSELFLDNGCLNRNALERYRKGDLSISELDLIHKHTKDCSVCRDALDGVKVLEQGKITHNLETLRGRYYQRNVSYQRKTSSAPVIRFFGLFILFSGLLMIFWFIKQQDNQRIDSPAIKKDTIPYQDTTLPGTLLKQ
ncbi:MAG: hypothetical protein MI922_14400 [Bacteroidales bacterium]|nr:hypothetical protein [Bacteroidales bacterium]